MQNGRIRPSERQSTAGHSLATGDTPGHIVAHDSRIAWHTYTQIGRASASCKQTTKSFRRGLQSNWSPLLSLTKQPGTVQEAADYLKVSTKTIRRYITQGLVEAERVGPRLIRVNLASLDNLGRSLQYLGGEAGDRR